MKCSLGISNFLEEISLVFPILLFSSISLHWLLRLSYISWLFFNILCSDGYMFSFLFCLLLLFLPRLFVKSSSDNRFAFLHFFSLGMVLIASFYTVFGISVHSSSGLLSGLILWICLSLPLYNHKGFDLGHTWMVSGSLYFLQFKSEFWNKDRGSGCSRPGRCSVWHNSSWRRWLLAPP